MSDIFISYARSDRERAQILARALEQNGWSVWWDRSIPVGKPFDQVIQKELNAARCIVVLWSKESVLSGWVRDEASEGSRREILVPILIEDTIIPLGFRLIQAASLIDWQGETDLPEFERLLDGIANLIRNLPCENAGESGSGAEPYAETHLPETPELKNTTAIRQADGQQTSAIVKALAYPSLDRTPSHYASGSESLIGRIKRHKASMVIALALLIVSVTAIIYSLRGNRQNVRRSIAVLPLANGLGNPDMEYLCDGISEGIINYLSRLDVLKVMARTTAFRFKNSGVDPLEIGRNLGVDAVFTGRVTQQGGVIIMQADLLDVSEGSQLWGESFSHKLTDIFIVQEEVARKISQKLRIGLTREEHKLLENHHTETPEAYQLYLKGRHYSSMETGEGIKKGIQYYESAIEADSNYALAYAGLAESYSIAATWLFPLAEAMENARKAAKKAIELDETLPEAHIALGLINNHYDWQWSQAESEFKRALDLKPNYAEAHQWYGDFLMQMGRFDEARLHLGQAREMDPLSLFISNDLGLISYYEGNYDQAIDQYLKTITMDPTYISSHILLGRAYAQKQMYDQAIAELQKARQLDDGPDILADLGRCYALSGRVKEARELLRELEELSRRKHVSAYYMSLPHIGLGEKKQSLEWLEKAYSERSSALIWLKVNPTLEILRSEAGFINLMRRVGIVQ